MNGLPSQPPDAPVSVLPRDAGPQQRSERLRPYRVMVVDDDATVAELYAVLLEKAGMATRVTTDPLQAIAAISEFQPEVLVTDVYMPGCSGPEMVTLLRQNEAYAELPVLFISTDADFRQQLAAFNLWGDEFLTKPIDPVFFADMVMARARRARYLNGLLADLRRLLKEREYQQLAMDQHAIVSITDTTGKITYANAKLCEASGYTLDELLGQNYRIVKSDYHPPEFFHELWSTIAAGKVWRGELCNRRKDASRYWVDSTIVPFLDEQGRPYQYVSVRTDISALKLSEEKLISAKEDAETANRAKSEFLSSMSHELRTPMNAILGFSQLLGMDDEQPLSPSQNECVHEIVKAGHHLLTLIDEVLDLSKVEAGHLDMSIEPVELTAVSDECLALIAPMAGARNIRVVWDDRSRRDLVVRADLTRLKQVLLNLISNGVKYNREGGTVTVHARPNGVKRVRISVTDTGGGIAPERQSELFRPFSRLGAENSEIAGTGIGLFISRKLITLMHGSIGVESEVGTGSTFWIELDSGVIPQADETAEKFAGRAARRIPITQEVSTVLYVEDNPANLKLVTQLFKKFPNNRLYTAHTPELGLEMTQAHRPDLILLDIQLPGMDGYALLRRLRAQVDTRDIPVVAITANAMPRDIEKGKAAGFDAYLTKPINVPLFLEVVTDLMAKKKQPYATV